MHSNNGSARGRGGRGGGGVFEICVTSMVFMVFPRAGHNFRCPLLSALSVVPLVNGTTVMFQF